MPRLADSLFVRLAVFAALLALPTIVSAQDAPDAPPAHVSVVDGGALLERDGGSETATASMPLLAGDRIRTQGGRVEVLFGDGSTLHLDANTLVDFQSDAVVRLLDGRVRLNIAGTNRGVAYRIDAPAAWVEVRSAGEYRVAVVDGNEVELAVLRGAADLINEDGRTSIGAGERAFARTGSRPSSAYVYNSAAWDNFDRWSEARRDSRLGVSAEYLPESVQPYASTLTSTAPGATSTPMATSGIRASASAGARTTAADGRRCGRGAGRGWDTTRGRGRRITTAAGASRPAPGSGFPATRGDRRTSRGPMRRAT